MIRGSIEFASADRIQGWIYTGDGRIREHTILAFHGEQCVGAGKVDTFRGDLAEAGIGDGHLGFSFPISVPAERVGSVVLKLEGSDAMLVQGGATVSRAGAVRQDLSRDDVRERLASLKWALKHGRIGQGDFDFLRILWSFGVYERGLVRRTPGEESVITDKPALVAAALLESYRGTDVAIGTASVRSPAEFAAEMARVAGRADMAPVVALHPAGRVVLRVAEGSHIEGGAGEGPRSGPTDYALTRDGLLMLDVRAASELQMPDGGSLDIVSAEPVH